MEENKPNASQNEEIKAEEPVKNPAENHEAPAKIEEIKHEEPKPQVVYGPENEPPKAKPFSGLKKGFLNSARPSPAEKQETAPPPEIPKPEPISQEEKRAKEIEGVKDFMLHKQDEWMTPELIQMCQKNKKLMKIFTNPEYIEGIALMRKDPKAAFERFGEKSEFVEIYTEFLKIMNGRFTAYNKKNEPLDAQTQKIKDIMDNDPEVKEILKDPQVINLMRYLGGRKLEIGKVMEKNPILAEKMNVLIKKGVVQFLAP